MNHSRLHDRDRRLRNAAILLASMDQALAEQMLSEMSTADGKAVRAAMAILDDIDPEEQRDVLNQFRRSKQLSQPTSTDAVELDQSLLARIEQQTSDDLHSSQQSSQDSLGGLSDAEATTIIETLSHEHPQTVALVISRLDHGAAAKLLSMLSPHLQGEVLGRLSELDPADEQSVQVVESHLAQWINHQRQRKQRMAAGAELVQRILECTLSEDRPGILARLGSHNPQLAERLGHDQPATSAALAPPSTPAGDRRRASRQYFAKLALRKSTKKPEAEDIADPLGELERVDDATLMETFAQADRQIVALALAGAGDGLMNRILKRLPRRQAKQFRNRLRDIGPTRLSDMLAAQQQLAQHARRMRRNADFGLRNAE